MRIKPTYIFTLFLFLTISLQMSAGNITSFDTGKTIHKVRLANEEDSKFIIASTYEGAILKMDYSGNTIWVSELSSQMNHDVWCEDITQDGKDEIFVANANGTIYCLDDAGTLKWSFRKNEAPMNSVCVLKKGDTQYIVCGGYDLKLYYLDINGNEIKQIETKTFGVSESWGENAPAHYKCHVDFVRPLNKADGSQILVLSARIHSMASWGKAYLFHPLDDKPFSIKSIPGNGGEGDLKTRDLDGDGNQEILVGKSEMIDGSLVVSINLSTSNSQSFSMNNFEKQLDRFGYRVTQPEVISENGTNKYLILFGSSIVIVPFDLNYSDAEVLNSSYSFNDMWKDVENNNIILASAQSGGSCIHIINLDDAEWKNAYRTINPPGKIQKILSNTQKAEQQVKAFKAPAWEQEQQKVYVTSKPSTSKINDIIANYETPVFLNYYWPTKIQNFNDWNRDTIPNKKYRERRDGRRLSIDKETGDTTKNDYTLSQQQCVEIMSGYLSGSSKGIATWGGHGNDPFYYHRNTLQEVIDVGKDKKKVFIYPELEAHDANFEWVINNHFLPLAKFCQGKNANIFVRGKNIFWQGPVHMPLWDEMKSGKYADVFVPGMEETTDKMMDVSVPGRMGYWLSGSVNAWGTRCARDNTSYDRTRQHSHQMVPNHFLRQYIYNVACGATYINRFGYNADYMAVLWSLIAKGALYIPQRDELLSISPVHLSMVDVNEHYLNEGTNVKWTTFYNETKEASNKMVFSHMNGTWPGASITAWDYSSYASGIKDRRLNYLPPNPNGMVLITPPQSGVKAQTNAPRGLLKDKLHPIYKNILAEFYTDGYKYYSADGKESYSADTYYKTVSDSIHKLSKKLPIKVEGDVAWVAAQTSAKHIRLTLIDGGYLNPSDKDVNLSFQTVSPVKITDVLDGTEFPAATTVNIDVPCGLFRFLDIELKDELESNYIDSLYKIETPEQITENVPKAISFSYQTKGERKVYIQLENTSKDSLIQSQVINAVGKRSVSVDFTPTTIKNGTDKYRWAIFLTSKDDSSVVIGKKYYADVRISDTIPPTQMELVMHSIHLQKGDSKKLSATFLPEIATHTAMQFTSTNQTIASVNATTGEVTAVSTGICQVLAKTKVGELLDTCLVSCFDNNSLPHPWQETFIGNANGTVGAGFSNEQFTIVGGGYDVWKEKDEFEYVFQPYSDNVMITAKVNFMENTNAWAKMGVMIRQDLSDNAKQVNCIITPEVGAHFQYRIDKGKWPKTTKAYPTNLQSPIFLRLKKLNTNFTAYYSLDEENWKSIGNMEVNMDNDFKIGCFVCSHNTEQNATAVFSDVVVEKIEPNTVNNTLWSEISVYPNPFKNILNVDLGSVAEFETIQLLDLNGKSVFESSCTEKTIQINVNHLSNSIYLLRLSGKNGTITQKIVGGKVP